MSADAAGSETVAVDAQRLTSTVADIFAAGGIAPAHSQGGAADVVAADLEGIASHGVMLVPMYIERINKGSVSRRSAGEVVSDRGGAIVIDAGNALGQLTSRQAVMLAVTRAKEIGLVAVTVRNGFHFGTARRYARMIAEPNCVGIVLSNTRPPLPPPRRAPVVGRHHPQPRRPPPGRGVPGGSGRGAGRDRHGQDPPRRRGGTAHSRGLGGRFARPAHDRSHGGDQRHAVAGSRAERIRPRLCHRSLVRRAIGRRGRRRGSPALRRSRRALSLLAFFSGDRRRPLSGGRALCTARARSGDPRNPIKAWPPRAARRASGGVCRLD